MSAYQKLAPSALDLPEETHVALISGFISALHAVFFFNAVLGSLYGAFTCALCAN